jgi:hypothetical protein
MIPMSKVDGLTKTLNSKASISDIEDVESYLNN